MNIKKIAALVWALPLIANTASAGEPVDRYGKPCIKLERLGTKKFSTIFDESNAVKHEYRFRNGCDGKVEVKITTGADWVDYLDIDGKAERYWFCTDRTKMNNACGGGISSYTVKYKSPSGKSDKKRWRQLPVVRQKKPQLTPSRLPRNHSRSLWPVPATKSSRRPATTQTWETGRPLAANRPR